MLSKLFKCEMCIVEVESSDVVVEDYVISSKTSLFWSSGSGKMGDSIP